MTEPLALGGATEELLEGAGSSELVSVGSAVLLELSVLVSVLEGASLLLESVGKAVAVMVV